MRVFFDARYTRFPTHFGVSRYGAELATALAKLMTITLIICDTRQLIMLPQGVPYVLLNNPLSIKELFIARQLNKLGADIVYTPLQAMGRLGRRYKLIVTMHDTFYFEYPTPPHYLPWYARLAWWLSYKLYWPQRWLLDTTDYVATVSRTSEQEIERYHLTKRPVGVVYNAPIKPPALPRRQTPKKELVYVSSFMKYKNHETLVRMINLLPDYTLHFTSPVWPERQAELTALAKRPEQLVFWNGAPEKEMYRLLAESMAAVSASKAEGFGLPVIEAMSMGTPVVCSDLPIFHEIAGPSVQYCDPDSPEAFAAAVRRLEDPIVAVDYTKKGLAQAKTFTWQHSAEQLKDIIETVAVHDT